MLLVVIAALVVALVDNRRRLTAVRAELQAAQARAEEAAFVAAYFERGLAPRPPVTKAGQPNPFGLDPVVFSEVAAQIAAGDLGGVPLEEVEADLAAIAEGMPQPIDISDPSAAYVFYRRDKKQSRAGAIRSARLELRLKLAAEAVEKAGAKKDGGEGCFTVPSRA
jgi:hypothetical protein